jgi:predicted signal transduction protein with EAL and GGDEF domain
VEDTVARMGGDEFLVLLPSLQSPGDAALVAQKITTLFASPLRIDDYELSVTASVGVSVFPFDGRDAESLLRNADNAMYRSKKEQRGGYELHDAATDAAAGERIRLEKGLRRAVEHSEFVLLYQPKVLLRTGKISGVEALLRWNHGDLGLLPPARFLAAAERMGLIRSLGAWVLGEACRQAVVWQKAGYPFLWSSTCRRISLVRAGW